MTTSEHFTPESLNKIIGGEWKVGPRSFIADLPLDATTGLDFVNALKFHGISAKAYNGADIRKGETRFRIDLDHPLIPARDETILAEFAQHRGITLPTSQKAIGA